MSVKQLLPILMIDGETYVDTETVTRIFIEKNYLTQFEMLEDYFENRKEETLKKMIIANKIFKSTMTNEIKRISEVLLYVKDTVEEERKVIVEMEDLLTQIVFDLDMLRNICFAEMLSSIEVSVDVIPEEFYTAIFKERIEEMTIFEDLQTEFLEILG